MEKITWSDQIGSRERSPWLLFVKGDQVFEFGRQDIPGVVVIRGTDYEKSGKWSHTTYRLIAASGVRHIAGMNGWETGRFVEGLGSAVGQGTPDTWNEVAECLGVSVPSAMEFLRAWRPKAAEALDRVEEAIFALEDAEDADSENVVVSFGNPTRREAAEGYWDLPKEVSGYAAEIRKTDLDGDWDKGNIEVVGISGTVLSVKYASGHGGGYYAVTVAVLPGTESEIPPFQLPEPEPVPGSEAATSRSSGAGALGEALRKAGVR